MAEPKLLEELRRLLDRQDEYVDDTFEVLTSQYEAAVRDVVDEMRAIVDDIETDGDQFTLDATSVARARLTAMQSMGAAATLWTRWEERLRRIAQFSDDYFETAGGGGKRPSAPERALLEEMIGLWPDAEQPGSGTAGRFYNLSAHHRQELANAVTRHVLGRTRKPQLVKELAERTKSSTRQAEQMIRDATIQTSRAVQASKATENDFEYFQYYGPVDSITRPFCSPLVNKVFSREEIDQMDNGQTGAGSVMVAGGGFRCRHHWMPCERNWFTEEEWEQLRGSI